VQTSRSGRGASGEAPPSYTPPLVYGLQDQPEKGEGRGVIRELKGKEGRKFKGGGGKGGMGKGGKGGKGEEGREE
jgi:hypothetical protein